MATKMGRRPLLAGAAMLPLLSLGGCAQRAPIDGGFTGIDVARGHALRDGLGMKGVGALTGGPGAASASASAGTAGLVRRVRVVVAGGGIAGLAAARALRLAGVDDFVVLEMEDVPGGNSRGGDVRGIACPLGAHYLPVPGDDAREVQDLLEELGLRKRVAGRWTYDEATLCHSPQERLYFRGAWQEGLVPVQDVSAATTVQYQRFSAAVAALAKETRFTIPTLCSPFAATLKALDAIPFAQWLDARGFDSPELRWYLDYCCRDDYGGGIRTVSAWAGLHYFAARHGFRAPDASDDSGGDSVLTWPEGNGWLARHLASPIGERLKTATSVLRIEETRSGVEVHAVDHKFGEVVLWQADSCVVALPTFIAARVVASPPDFLQRAAAAVPHAPWLVANVHLHEPLADKGGAAPAWDNVIHGDLGLGYVDARHQSLDPTPGPTVLTWYLALGDAGDGRRRLLQEAWTMRRDQVLQALSMAHPDVRDKATRIDIMRYGHAMAMPVPGLRSALPDAPPATSRLHFAHADWSGYSIFEEAFTRGHLAGSAAVSAKA